MLHLLVSLLAAAAALEETGEWLLLHLQRLSLGSSLAWGCCFQGCAWTALAWSIGFRLALHHFWYLLLLRRLLAQRNLLLQHSSLCLMLLSNHFLGCLVFRGDSDCTRSSAWVDSGSSRLSGRCNLFGSRLTGSLLLSFLAIGSLSLLTTCLLLWFLWSLDWSLLSRGLLGRRLETLGKCRWAWGLLSTLVFQLTEDRVKRLRLWLSWLTSWSLNLFLLRREWSYLRIVGLGATTLLFFLRGIRKVEVGLLHDDTVAFFLLCSFLGWAFTCFVDWAIAQLFHFSLSSGFLLFLFLLEFSLSLPLGFFLQLQ